ncbi:hypothetical protein D9M72_519100 [compost metagenome]
MPGPANQFLQGTLVAEPVPLHQDPAGPVHRVPAFECDMQVLADVLGHLAGLDVGQQRCGRDGVQLQQTRCGGCVGGGKRRVHLHGADTLLVRDQRCAHHRSDGESFDSRPPPRPAVIRANVFHKNGFLGAPRRQTRPFTKFVLQRISLFHHPVGGTVAGPASL